MKLSNNKENGEKRMKIFPSYRKSYVDGKFSGVILGKDNCHTSFLKNLFYVYVILAAHISEHHVPGTCGGEKGIRSPEMDLLVVSGHIGAGNQAQVHSLQEWPVLVITEPLLQPHPYASVNILLQLFK